MDEEVIYNALGYSIFENLRPQNILFEGWRDKRLFQVALQGVPTRHRRAATYLRQVGVCHAKGAKDIRHITPMLELAGLDWLVVSDSDRPAVEQRQIYQGAGPWYLYNELLSGVPALTGEDFIKPEAVKAATRRVRGEYPDLPELTVSDLSAGRPKIEVLRSWLQSGGMAADRIKPALNTIKDQIYTNLKASQIENAYFELLGTLAAKLNSA